MSNLSNKTIVIIAFFAVITGLLLISSDYLKSKKDQAYQKISVSLFVQNDNEKQDNTPQNVEETPTTTEPTTPVQNPTGYIGVLTISKIDLSQGFFDKSNPDNNVSKNITILQISNYPNEQNGNVILVSHSGSSHIAYFKHLYQLSVGDVAQIEYKGKIYTYKIANIYNETKDGNVTIYRDTSKSTLTMITCTKNDNTKQTVYISYLQSIK